MKTLQCWLSDNEFTLLPNDKAFLIKFFGTLDQEGIPVESNEDHSLFVMPGVVVVNDPTGTTIDRDTNYAVRSWPTSVEVRGLIGDGIDACDLFTVVSNAQTDDSTPVIIVP